MGIMMDNKNKLKGRAMEALADLYKSQDDLSRVLRETEYRNITDAQKKINHYINMQIFLSGVQSAEFIIKSIFKNSCEDIIKGAKELNEERDTKIIQGNPNRAS